MAKELFLNTRGACFLCLREPLSDIEDLMSEVNLRKICRYLDISQSSIFPKVLKRNLWEEEKEPQFLKEKCEYSIAMCSTCSSLTNKLTDLINQMEMINNLLAYQLQIFRQKINGPVQDASTDDLRMRLLKSGSSSKVDISLVETLRARIDKKCSQKVKDILESNLPKVLLKRLESGNQEKNLSPLAKNANSSENALTPPKRNDVSSLQSFPILQDPLSLSTPHHHLANLEPESEILSDPLADQDLQSTQLEDCSFHKRNFKETCKKYSKILQNKLHCSLCSFSNGSCSTIKLRHHLVAVHPEVFFKSQRQLHLDTKVSFNDHCKYILSTEIYQAKQRARKISNRGQWYQCEFCERKIAGYMNFKYHLLMDHFKIVEEKLIAGFRKMKDIPEMHKELRKSGNEEKAENTVDSIEPEVAPPPVKSDHSSILSSPTLLEDPLSSSSQNHHLPNLEPEPEILLNPPVDHVIPQNLQSIQLEVASHKRKVLETCKKYSKILQNEVRCSLCNYSYKRAKDSAAKLRHHLVGVHPEILFTSQRHLHMGNHGSFNACCRCLLSSEITRAKQRAISKSNGESCYPCEFCERKSKFQFDFKYHLLMKHFKIVEDKLSAGNCGLCGSLEEAHRPLQKDKIKDEAQSQQPVADDGEIFIVPDLVVNGRIKSGKEIAKSKTQTFHKRKPIVCSKEDGGCGKFFSNRYILRDHKRKHCASLGRRERWTCEILEGGCGRIFRTKSNLQRHQQCHCSRQKWRTDRNFEILETDDNLSVSLECSVEDVVMSKVEVFDGLDS